MSNEEMVKLSGMILSLTIAVISLLWSYLNSKKLERYKHATQWQVNHLSTLLVSYTSSLDALFIVFKAARELLEENIERKRTIHVTMINEVLAQLRVRYNDSLKHLTVTHMQIDGKSIEVYSHEHKNLLRNALEELRDGDRDEGSITLLQNTLITIRSNERKLLDAFIALRTTMPDILFRRVE